jgi:hypothetical protein
MSRAEMDVLGWDTCDIIIVTGDAYVDHPSFGTRHRQIRGGAETFGPVFGIGEQGSALLGTQGHAWLVYQHAAILPDHAIAGCH